MVLRPGFEFSAGGVVLDKKKVLLIKTSYPDGPAWAFPKGKIEKGESPRQAALREVREETGYTCKIEKYLGETRYFFFRKKKKNELVNKKVIWFLMSLKNRQEDAVKGGHLNFWVHAQETDKLLTYQSDRHLFKKVPDLLRFK